MAKPPLPPKSSADYGQEQPVERNFRVSDSVHGQDIYRWSDARRQTTRWIWQPLACHGLDVAACADVWCEREPEELRLRLAALLGLDWALARPWLLLLVACHGVGQASPGCWREGSFGSRIGSWPASSPSVEPSFVGQVALRNLLEGRGWTAQIAGDLVDAVVCHSGPRAEQETLDAIRADEHSMGGERWEEARRSLFETCLSVFRPPVPPSLRQTTRQNLPLLSEMTRRAVVMASDEASFPQPGDVDIYNFEGWFKRSSHRAAGVIGR